MKAVLVIDMPMDCYECPCSNEGCYLCQIRRRLLEDDFQDRRPSWCPLRPLPQKKGKHGELHEYDTDIHYEIGWNDCIDEIVGETE